MGRADTAAVNRRNVGLAAAVAVVLVAVVVGLLVVVPRLLYPPLSAAQLRGIGSAQTRVQLQQAQSDLRGDARSDVLQGLGGLLLVLGGAATWRQVQVSREGQLTERFTRAVDQVGSETLDVRLGGIYALGRLARSSPADRPAVAQVLGAFVRGRAPWPVGSPGGPDHPTPLVDTDRPWLYVAAPDVQAAMNVLGGVGGRGGGGGLGAVGGVPLYLSRTDLRRLHLPRAHLAGAQWRHVNLARAWLPGTVLDGGDLKAADLRAVNAGNASFVGTNLRGAWLAGADVTGADFRRADLRGADLATANLDRARLAGARADAATVWPPHLDSARRRDLGVVESG
ncbi:Pentapeptide repeat-containing protein [Frankia sp. AiPs1]|uniref:pentapeptide repeat-containing protein n=1 Tax=Frankia sp. AiPa1 TaxID=573492 RepID=UPI00202B0F3F|nr:pentapeptide repeat-containing protein [Frankia sp. AiPa1]MCL9759060.1 pentapeptide repeat-containing protein [Frankia sp. AiPa1]